MSPAATLERPGTVPEERTPAPLAGFLGGVLLSQVVNSALHLAQPLLVYELTGSAGKAAFFSSFDTAVHMAGSFLGGWPCDKLGARRLLSLSTFLRGACLALIPLMWAAGRLTVLTAMAAYTLDAFVRGFTDTAVHALPLELGAGERAELDRLNSRYELVFDLGGVAGPLMLGGLMMNRHGMLPHIAVPMGFALAAAIFLTVPKGVRRSRRGGSFEGLGAIFSSRALLVPVLGAALLNLYPLRKLLSAFFAKSILAQPHAAGWVGAAFGLGGALGTLAYGRWAREGDAKRWVLAGGAGTLLLAAGWAPASLWPMLAAAFAFAFANVCGRLALTRRVQEATPAATIGGVTASARFAANGVSVGLKALVGAAFAMGASPYAAFGVVGAGLAVVALAQLLLALVL